VRGSRGGPSSRTRPPPRGRQHSCVTPLAKTPDKVRNSAACTQSGGAVFQESRTRVWVPPVGLRRTLGRVARPAEHRAVADVERRAPDCERHDVVNGQVARGVGRTLVARAPVAVLATPCPEYSRTQVLPGPRAVQGVVAAPVRQPGMDEAPTPRSARDDTADRAELHARRGAGTVAARLTLVTLGCRPFDIATSVSGVDAAVYSPTVLRLRDQSWASGERIGRTRGPVAPGHELLELRPPVDLLGADAEMDGSEADVRTRRASGVLARCQLSPRGSSRR